MAGKGTISVNQVPQYGDKTKLASLQKNLTKTPMSGVPYPAPTAGRPATGQTPQQPAAGQPTGVPSEHQTLMQQYATAFRTNQFWQGVLAQYPSEFARLYADEAQAVLNNVAKQLRNTTPFFE